MDRQREDRLHHQGNSQGKALKFSDLVRECHQPHRSGCHVSCDARTGPPQANHRFAGCHLGDIEISRALPPDRIEREPQLRPSTNPVFPTSMTMELKSVLNPFCSRSIRSARGNATSSSGG
jgi:hypothetical protein